MRRMNTIKWNVFEEKITWTDIVAEKHVVKLML